MAFFIELARLFAVICGVFLFSCLAHLTLTLWQALPIEEEKSTPVYITKEITK